MTVLLFIFAQLENTVLFCKVQEMKKILYRFAIDLVGISEAGLVAHFWCYSVVREYLRILGVGTERKLKLWVYPWTRTGHAITSI